MDENLRVDKKIDDNDSFLKTNYFFGNTHNKKVSEHELKNINNYKLDKYSIPGNDFKDLDKTVKPSEYAFFLYDNQNMIKETYISEIQKKVSLIGGVWYFVNAGSDGKIELVTSKNKLKFNVKETATLSSFNLAIAPVIASNKIEFRQKKIKNILIISKFTKNKKRKMTEIVDTLMIKALQNFETYTILNPLDIDIRSNYMTEKNK